MADFLKIPGMPELRQYTTGHSEIKIAIIDGGIDLSNPCFKGADLSVEKSYWLDEEGLDAKLEEDGKVHGTFISSVLLGQSETIIEGIAPKCTGEFIRFAMSSKSSTPELDMVRAINAAHDAGADIIHISVATPTLSGKTDDLLTKAIQNCIDDNIIIVAPAGNDDGECLCIPAAIPGVLAVGALNDKGVPFRFSNWGGIYQKQGITAPGENIKAAKAGGGTIEEKGTSCAAPIVTGIAALLMSLQKLLGVNISADEVKNALLASIKKEELAEIEGEERERYLAGKLNISGAMQQILKNAGLTLSEKTEVIPPAKAVESNVLASACVKVSDIADKSKPTPEKVVQLNQKNIIKTIAKVQTDSTVSPSAVKKEQNTGHVYSLGTLGYDFGSEARRDTFKQLMAPDKTGDILVPANPYDARQMVRHFESNLSETLSVIWTLNLDLTPIYAIEGDGPFARDVYEKLVTFLRGQIKSKKDKDFIEKICIPGIITEKTVKLFSGQILPVIKMINSRGMYGWKINNLVNEAIASMHESKKGAKTDRKVSKEQLVEQLQNFLERVYYSLRNPGTTSSDRALNYAATNAFQATTVFSDSLLKGMELDDIYVEKSPFGRMDSDCWDVILKFFNPVNNRHSKRVYRFTIDVSETIPVSIGKVRSWSVS